MNVISINGFAFRIPEVAARYRANCSGEWGVFVTGETKEMTCSQAEKAGLTRGNFVEMALCWVDQKCLTFQPNYINEDFTEIWGIPTAGGIKETFHEKASELSTFLIHRQSRDKMAGLFETVSREAFNEWVASGMQGDAHQHGIEKAAQMYFTQIFRFELVRTKGNYGPYFFVQTTYRKAEENNPLEMAALEAAKQIYEAQMSGQGFCSDPRIEENHRNCLASLGEALPSQTGTAELPPTKPVKLLKNSNTKGKS